MAELPDNVTEALDQESFDVLSFVTGDLTPRSTVQIYTDYEAGYRLNEILEGEEEFEKTHSDSLSIADETYYADPDEIDALKARIESSKLTFELKALAPALKDAMRKSLVAKHNFKADSTFEENEDYYTEFQNELVARTIAKATNSKGQTDSKWTAAKIETLRGRILASEGSRLDDAVYKVSGEGELFDRAVGADFLSKR